MKPSTVVEVEIGTYTRFQLPHVLIAFQVDVFIFEASPQTLNSDIVQCPPCSVHTDLNVVISKHLEKHIGGKLAPLIRVEYGRTPSLSTSQVLQPFIVWFYSLIILLIVDEADSILSGIKMPLWSLVSSLMIIVVAGFFFRCLAVGSCF